MGEFEDEYCDICEDDEEGEGEEGEVGAEAEDEHVPVVLLPGVFKAPASGHEEYFMLLDEEKLLLSCHFIEALGHEVEHAILVLIWPVHRGKIAVGPVPGCLVAEAVHIAHPNLKNVQVFSLKY